MKFWYIVELKCEIQDGALGKPISAEIVDIIPRYTDGCCEWNDTEEKKDGLYTRRVWHTTKARAKKEISIWMKEN
jgi:hypothetical protein